MPQNSPYLLMQRIVIGIFGLLFISVGILMLIFLWAMFGFTGPGLLISLIPGLVSLIFIGSGLTTLVGAFTGEIIHGPMTRNRKLLEISEPFQQLQQFFSDHVHQQERQENPSSRMNSVCPRCSAPIGEAEISPSGDVKCLHCKNWYNVRH